MIGGVISEMLSVRMKMMLVWIGLRLICLVRGMRIGLRMIRIVVMFIIILIISSRLMMIVMMVYWLLDRFRIVFVISWGICLKFIY